MRTWFEATYQSAIEKLPDWLSVQLQYFRAHRRLANLRKPKTMTEKITHRKIRERDPRFTKLADKVLVKDFVASELGKEWTIPTLWSGVELPREPERDWPNSYVIKANHGSGWNIFVTNPANLDWEAARAVTNDWIRNRYRPFLREHFYNDIRPQLLIEPYVGVPGIQPPDIKLFCYHGRVEYIMHQSDRHKGLRIALFDRNWGLLPWSYEYPRPEATPQPPQSLQQMLTAAEKLSQAFSFVRIDLYEIEGTPLFGEFTFAPGSGLHRFNCYEADLAFGKPWRM